MNFMLILFIPLLVHSRDIAKNSRYIYSIGGKGFLTYGKDSQNEHEIYINKAENLEERSFRDQSIYRIDPSGENDMSFIYLDDLNEEYVLDISGRNKHLISYKKHGGSNQQFLIRLTKDFHVRILENGRCLEYEKDDGYFFVNTDGCYDERHAKYQSQVFKIFEVLPADFDESDDSNFYDDDSNINHSAYQNRNKPKRHRSSNQDGEDFLDDSDSDVNTNDPRNRDGDSPKIHKSSYQDQDDSDSKSIDEIVCRKCLQRQGRSRNNLKSSRSSDSLSNRSYSEDEDGLIYPNLERVREKRRNRLRIEDDDSIKGNDQRMINSRNSSRKKNFSNMNYPDKNCTNHNDYPKKKNNNDGGNANNFFENKNSVDHNLDDKLIHKLSSLGNSCCDSQQTDSLNPICSSEINKKVQEISEMIPITLNF